MKWLLLVVFLVGCENPLSKMSRDLDELNKQLEAQNDELDHMIAELRCINNVNENLDKIHEIKQKQGVSFEEAYDIFVDTCTAEIYKTISTKK